MAVVTPIRPNWDLDDPEHAVEETDDDFEYVDPDAVPVYTPEPEPLYDPTVD